MSTDFSINFGSLATLPDADSAPPARDTASRRWLAWRFAIPKPVSRPRQPSALPPHKERFHISAIEHVARRRRIAILLPPRWRRRLCRSPSLGAMRGRPHAASTAIYFDFAAQAGYHALLCLILQASRASCRIVVALAAFAGEASRFRRYWSRRAPPPMTR